MFRWFRKDNRGARVAEAYSILDEPTKADILDMCANDVERRSLCLQWAGEARTKWYERRKQYIASVVQSDSPRYKGYPIEVRKSIGDQQWARSVEQKDLAAQEQMYTRWATGYAGGPGSREK